MTGRSTSALSCPAKACNLSYYDVPPEYEVPVYKYAIINGQMVLVDPQSHRIMQIID